MRIKVLPAIISITLVGCNKSTNNDMPPTSEISIEDLSRGAIVHDSLTTKQTKDIERIHRVFSEVNATSLKETIDNFKSDRNPDREIAIWSGMADAYERFTLNKHIEEYDKKMEAFQLLLVRSMMTEEEIIQKMEFSYLSADDVKEIFSYYTDLPKPISIESVPAVSVPSKK